MRNARLDEAQTGIKIAGRNINNLKYADDTTLMAESEEELKSLLMKVKEESEKVGLREAWHAAIHGVAKSQTRLSDWTELNWDNYIQVKKQQLEPDIEQQTGFKLGKEYIKAVYCHPTYLTYMQSTPWETLGWMKHKLESRLPGELSITSDTQMTPPLWQKVKKN